MSFWTPERIAELRTRRAAGETRAQIGAAIGTTERAIKHAVNTFGLSGHQDPPELEREVLTLRDAGYSARKITMFLKADRHAVARILNRNIATAPTSRPKRARQVRDPEMQARVVALRNSGMEYAAVADQLGIPVRRAKIYGKLGGARAGIVARRQPARPAKSRAPRPARAPGPPMHVHKKPRAPRINMGGDPPKEAGHFVTWNAITAGTSMAGEPFPGWA